MATAVVTFGPDLDGVYLHNQPARTLQHVRDAYGFELVDSSSVFRRLDNEHAVLVFLGTKESYWKSDERHAFRLKVGLTRRDINSYRIAWDERERITTFAPAIDPWRPTVSGIASALFDFEANTMDGGNFPFEAEFDAVRPAVDRIVQRSLDCANLTFIESMLAPGRMENDSRIIERIVNNALQGNHDTIEEDLRFVRQGAQPLLAASLEVFEPNLRAFLEDHPTGIR